MKAMLNESFSSGEYSPTNRFYEEPGKLKSPLQFCENNQPHSALITTIDLEGQHEQKDIRLTYVPAALYAYMVGYSTLSQNDKN